MAKRPSIGAAMRQDAHTPPHPPVTAPSAVQASRAGKVNISGYFPPEVKSSLRLVQAKNGGKIQDLVAEALNLLFAKYGVPESAPTPDLSHRRGP